MKERKTKFRNIRLTPTMLKEIRKTANKKDITQGQLVREAIRQYLEKEENK